MVYLQKLYVMGLGLSFFPEVNWVDLIVVIFLFRGGYIGFSRGFSVELFKVLGAIACTVVSLLYYQEIGQWLASHSFLSLPIANFLSFVALIVVLLFISKITRVFVFRVLHLELFYGWEKWGGLILGLARSVVLVSLFLFVITLLPIEYLKESVEENSFCGLHFKEITPKVLNFVIKFRPKD